LLIDTGSGLGMVNNVNIVGIHIEGSMVGTTGSTVAPIQIGKNVMNVVINGGLINLEASPITDVPAVQINSNANLSFVSITGLSYGNSTTGISNI
jgi:hypothetical protein